MSRTPETGQAYPRRVAPQLTRDAWLFLILGHIGLAAAVVVLLASSRGRLTGMSEEAEVALCVAGTAWLTLTGAGFWKLWLARNAGPGGAAREWGLRFLGAYGLLIVLGLLALIPRRRAVQAPYVVAEVLFFLLALVLLRRIFTRKEPPLSPASEGLVLFALGHLYLFVYWAWPGLSRWPKLKLLNEWGGIWSWMMYDWYLEHCPNTPDIVLSGRVWLFP